MRLYSFCLAVETVRIVSGHTGRIAAKLLVVAAVAAAAAGFAVGSSAGPDRHGAGGGRFGVKSRVGHREVRGGGVRRRQLGGPGSARGGRAALRREEPVRAPEAARGRGDTGGSPGW